MATSPPKASLASLALLILPLAPAPPAAAQPVVSETERLGRCSDELSAALDRIARALEAQLSDRRVEMMLRRVDLTQRRLDPLVARLDSARSTRGSLAAESTRLRHEIRRTVERWESSAGDIPREELDQMTERLRSELEIVASQAAAADNAIVQLENEAQRLRREIDEWISWLDRNLEGP